MTRKVWMATGLAAALIAPSALAGPEWVEDGDAGRLPGTAQRTSGGGTVTTISGRLEGLEAPSRGGLNPDDFEDLYIIYIDDPCDFTVFVDPCFDARLYLFTLDGFGVLASDESGYYRGKSSGVMIDGCEILPGPGEYIIGIVADSREPVSDTGSIFTLPPMGQTTPNGPGAGDPLIDWIGEVTSPFGCGEYDLELTGASLAPPVNDDCFDATPIGLVTDQPYTTLGATEGLTSCSIGEMNDIWFIFTAPSDGTVQVDLCGSFYDTMLGIYDGDSCDPLPPLIECNDDTLLCDDSRGSSSSLQSAIQFEATAGNSYLIQVGGFAGITGNGDITIQYLGSPCDLPGRPDPDGTSDRVIRGFILAWAVNDSNQEIRWNHLAGTATVVDYRDGFAAEYGAVAYPVMSSAAAHGEQSGTPGVLNLDSNEYAATYDQLLLNFLAPGSLVGSGPGSLITAETDLTLHILDADLTMNSSGPVTTKVEVNIWNRNETKFSNTRRCITCWDEVLLSQFAANASIPNNFLLSNLQTNEGKARIAGVAADECPDSTAAALLGVSTRILSSADPIRGRPGPDAAAATNLFGLGARAATISYDVLNTPDEINSTNRPRRPGTEPEMQVARGLVDATRRGSAFEKGSLLVFSKVEIKLDEFGNIIQDTFLQLTNDFAEDVRVQMMFVNGDDPMTEIAGGAICEHPGWNWVDNEILLTGNQTLYWSAATGNPAAVSPWTILDP